MSSVSPELRADIEKALKTLRQADSQAAAVSWMTNAYRLLEACLEVREEPRFIFEPAPPKLQIVQSIPSRKFIADELRSEQERSRRLQIASRNQTVVYPEIHLPSGLKPLPKPWTREDTRRLERAAKTPVKRIQRLGK